MEKTLLTIMTIFMAAIMVFAGCGENEKPQPRISDTMPGTEPAAPPRQQKAAISPVKDARMIIAGLQNDLVPLEQALTDEQQAKITEAFNPDTPSDMRGVFGALTPEQKNVLVSRIRLWLAESDHPFTDEQVSRYMAFGPESEELAPTDIMKPEQIQTIMELARARMRQQQQQQQ